MRVVVRNNKSVLFQGDGPIIAVSSYYAKTQAGDEKLKGYLTAIPSLPAWMKTYLESGKSIVSADLHFLKKFEHPDDATSLQVTAVPGAGCE